MITEPDALQLVPCFRYRDSRAAIAFLKSAFGFSEQLIVEDGTGAVEHAQLTLGPTMVMIGSEKDDDLDFRSAETLGGNSQTVYAIVPDDGMVDAIHDRARAAGATIVRGPESPDYGGRMVVVRDPEGHVWTFGSYNPWSPPAGPAGGG